MPFAHVTDARHRRIMSMHAVGARYWPMLCLYCIAACPWYMLSAFDVYFCSQRMIVTRAFGENYWRRRLLGASVTGA